MSLFFTQFLSFHTFDETYLYCVSLFTISENPHCPELLKVIKTLRHKKKSKYAATATTTPQEPYESAASTEVRSSSLSIPIWNSVVRITLHLVTEFFRNTYLSSSSNVSRWAACAGIWRSCAYTTSNWRTRNRPCHGLWTG